MTQPAVGTPRLRLLDALLPAALCGDTMTADDDCRSGCCSANSNLNALVYVCTPELGFGCSGFKMWITVMCNHEARRLGYSESRSMEMTVTAAE